MHRGTSYYVSTRLLQVTYARLVILADHAAKGTTSKAPCLHALAWALASHHTQQPVHLEGCIHCIHPEAYSQTCQATISHGRRAQPGVQPAHTGV
jgi:hypothetical protein